MSGSAARGKHIVDIGYGVEVAGNCHHAGGMGGLWGIGTIAMWHTVIESGLVQAGASRHLL